MGINDFWTENFTMYDAKVSIIEKKKEMLWTCAYTCDFPSELNNSFVSTTMPHGFANTRTPAERKLLSSQSTNNLFTN